MPGGVVSFFGSAVRGGDWLVPAHFRVVAVVGKVRLDLRRARFTSPTTTIEAAVFAGHLEIGLPAGSAWSTPERVWRKLRISPPIAQ